MKSILIEKEKDKYPKLMQIKDGFLSGSVVLFTDNKIGFVVHAKGIGFVVHGKGRHTIGKQSDYWDMDNFENFTGTLELSNE